MQLFKYVVLGMGFGLFGSSAVSFADDSSTGCGPGWMVTKNYSFSATTTRNTTNSYIVPWAMTTGTSGCKKHTIVMNQRGLEFIEVNREELAQEAARGQGEYLAALAASMGCSPAVFDKFGYALRSHYAVVFEGQQEPVRIIQEIESMIVNDAVLNSQCAAV